jgi:DNA gyrase subunit A
MLKKIKKNLLPTVPTTFVEEITDVAIAEKMRTSYLDYSMSVIVGRALPDIRDGLKPVHRRILYSMQDLGCEPDKPYRKSARIVGDCLGKYHPHGDMAIYDSLVRMAQEFTMRYPLIQGHGNFGSIDGDSAAASRYTEARLSTYSNLLLDSLDPAIVEFGPNFDNSLKEPLVLPAKLPNLLLNGSSGIAVGMATNIPPHNLSEICEALLKIIDNRINNKETTVEALAKIIKGPDFPTGGQIIGLEGIKDYLTTGHGSVIIRSNYTVEKEGKLTSLIITEIPYEVNKAELVIQIANLIKDKRLNMVSDIRDESGKEGIRVVLELKKDAVVDKVALILRKHTMFQKSYRCSMLALDKNVPKTYAIDKILACFLEFRETTLGKKFSLELAKNEERLNILNGLKIAILNITEVTDILKKSKELVEAKAKLIKQFSLNEAQVKAILEMRLASLVSLEVTKIENEVKERKEKIAYFTNLLSDVNNIRKYIQTEIKELALKNKSERLTKILAEAGEEADNEEDLIEDKDVMVIITKDGYIKTVPNNTFRAQLRGGVGVENMNIKNGDFIKNYFSARKKQKLILFTNKGRAYSIPVYKLPEERRQGSGENLSLLLGIQTDEIVTEAITLPPLTEKSYFFIVTRSGKVKKMELAAFDGIRTTGKTFISLLAEDEVIAVRNVKPNEELLIASNKGLGVRINESTVRTMGVTAVGVKGMRLARGATSVVGMEIVHANEPIALLTRKGYGKRLLPSEVRQTNRGSVGVKIYILSKKTSDMAALTSGSESLDLIASTNNGQTIRVSETALPLLTRNSCGVKVMRLKAETDTIAAIETIQKLENDLPAVEGPEPPSNSPPAASSEALEE